MVSCSVFLPPTGMGRQVAPPSPLFASYWQYFRGPASHLLGKCHILDDLRSTHTPSKYLRATYSHMYMCYVSTSYSTKLYTYTYIYIYICMYLHLYIYLHIYRFIYLRIYAFTYVYLFTYIHIYILYLYVNMCTYI